MKDNSDTFCKVQFNSNILEVPKVCSVLIKSYADDSLSDIRVKLNKVCSNMSLVNPETDLARLSEQVFDLIKIRKELALFDDKLNGMLSILEDVVGHYSSKSLREEVLTNTEEIDAAR